MPSRIFARLWGSTAYRMIGVALVWLALISWAHFQLNVEKTGRPVIRMGYMPVITNLAAPLLDHATKEGTGIRFEAMKFSSFAEMGEALRNDHIQAAFIIAPLSIVLHQQGAGVKIVYIGNRHESTLVYRKDLKVDTFSDLSGRTVAVPLRFSGHNIATRQLAEKFGVTGDNLRIVEMNPPDMPSALSTGALDAYFVGEPFATKTSMPGDSKVLYYVEQFWPGFICNLTIMRKEYIEKYPERVAALVQGAARSGLWARNNEKAAAAIASKYWNQPIELVQYTLEFPPNRTVFDRFMPVQDEIQYLADQMVKFKLIESNAISGLVDDRFAKTAKVDGVTDFDSILNPH